MKHCAHKFRIYPTKEQEVYFEKCFRTSNFIYNYFLSIEKETDFVLNMYGLYNRKDPDKKFLSKYKTENNLWFNPYTASKQLTIMSKMEKFNFLREVDATIRSYTLDSLNDGFTNIKKTGSGYPKFKNKNNNHNSVTGQIQYRDVIPLTFKISKKEKNNNSYYKINIPKLKNLECVIHKEDFILYWNNKDMMKLNSYTISKNPNGEYYISIQVENPKYVEITPKEITKENSIGIDFGVNRPVTTTIKEDFDNPLFSKKFDFNIESEKKVKKLDRILAKKRENNPNYKTSNKYNRIKKKKSDLQSKIAKQRSNLQHNISSQIVNTPKIEAFIIEDLRLINMTKRAKLKNVKQKSGLNKSLLNVGISTIVTQVEYKSKDLGKSVIKVTPVNTSITCFCCGYINKKNRVSQSLFVCLKCGHTDNADSNAGLNIQNNYFKKLVLLK